MLALSETSNAREKPGGRLAAVSPGPVTERWYAAETLPHKEALVVEHLERQSFHTFCPMERVERHHARKVYKTLTPVFRGYVFVRMDPSVVRWRSINGTWGVRALLANSEGPIPVRPGVVETLRASTDDDGILHFAEPLRPGMFVRLLSGPLAEELGIIERLDGKKRVQLLLNFMGSGVRAVVDRSLVRQASPYC